MTSNIIAIIKLSFECLLSARTYGESSKGIFHLMIKIKRYILLFLFLFKLGSFLGIP